MTTPAASTDALCLACGMCCDGTLFKNVELQVSDDPQQLTTLGLPVKENQFAQPCAALCSDLKCRIYDGRPAQCRQFECALLEEVKAFDVDLPGALRVVAQTRQAAEKVRRLLRGLGDTEEGLALSLRFQRMKTAMENGGLNEENAESYAELSLAVNDLTRYLAARFYG